MIDRRSPTLSTEQVGQLFRALRSADSVELKLTVPDANQRSAVQALDMDPLDAQIRQVVFFDTPELDLYHHGLVVRARRIQGKAGDTTVKLRPLVADDVPAGLRASEGFTIEVDAMPGGFVCSGALKASVDDIGIKGVLSGGKPLRKLLTKQQRALYADHAPEGLELGDLTMLGPINVFKLKFTPKQLTRKLVAELWNYPDASRILELSTKCEPTEAFEVASETRSFLAAKGIDAVAEQQTKTRTALEFFADEVSGRP